MKIYHTYKVQGVFGTKEYDNHDLAKHCYIEELNKLRSMKQTEISNNVKLIQVIEIVHQDSDDE